MKFLLIILMVIVALGLYVWPRVRSERACYHNAQSGLLDMSQRMVAQGVNLIDVCEARSYILSDLGDCINNSTASGKLTTYIQPIVQGAVSLSRPFSKGSMMLRSEHNLECQAYARFQLP